MQASERLRIVVLDKNTIPERLEAGSFSFANDLVVHDATDSAQLPERIRNADVVVTNKVRITAEALDHAKVLKLIAVAATGTDVIDLDACRSRGVTVSNIRNYAGNTVPEHTFALIMALRRSILAYRDSVRNGRWSEANQFCYFDFPIHDLAGSTLGIIGDGVLGRAVADLGRALKMKVLFSDHKGSSGMGPLYTSFPEVLSESDIITLHLPLLASTRNLIGDEEFSMMKRKPLLINTARGGLVDEEALERALKNGQLGGAGFDVATEEPPSPHSPLMRLLDLPNFILTPHVAWASREAIRGLVDQMVDNIECFVRGDARNVVA